MIKILDDKTYEEIWNFIYKKYKFNPSIKLNVKPFVFKDKAKCYQLKSMWNDEQEQIVNDLFKNISNDEIYALEWRSDCFAYNPHNYNEIKKHWYDQARECDVHFPSYYPNGDYYFFLSKDFSYGLLGHPWRREIYVLGDALIEQFEQNEEVLNIIQNEKNKIHCKKLR